MVYSEQRNRLGVDSPSPAGGVIESTFHLLPRFWSAGPRSNPSNTPQPQLHHLHPRTLLLLFAHLRLCVDIPCSSWGHDMWRRRNKVLLVEVLKPSWGFRRDSTPCTASLRRGVGGVRWKGLFCRGISKFRRTGTTTSGHTFLGCGWASSYILVEAGGTLAGSLV